MWMLLCLGVVAAFGKGETLLEGADSHTEDGGDAWTASEWLPESENEISPVIDMDELGERLRKSVHLLKSNRKLELVVLIDSSSSIGEENFKSELKFIQKLVADFNVGPSDARVAVIGFASTAETYVNHFEQEVHEKCSFLHNELPRTKYTGGNTNTIGALLSAREIFGKSREGAEKALFLVTDGFSNKGDPVPTARQLRESGITIFTFSIQNGNVREVRAMSSTPTENYSFILDSFSDFEALTRRALHEDLKSGSYVALNDTALCDVLCSLNSSSQTGCCNDQSRCTCGILTGQFACLCPQGFYGSGLVGENCLPCPKGTYNDGSTPGDILACMPCPDINHTTVKVPATSENDCVCREGYVAVDGECQVATCPVLTAPTNGYFVKKNCSNAINAACGVRCHTGYKLHGSSVRICRLNGTWTGRAPTCVPKSCKKPKPVQASSVACKNEDYGLKSIARYDPEGKETESFVVRAEAETAAPGDELSREFNFTVDTVCVFKCLPGYTMIGSKQRTCLPILLWNGLATSCTVVSCPSLSVLKDGFMTPENCTIEGLRHQFATECSASCNPGYRLEGPTIRNCTGRRGTWTGKKHPNKCFDVEPPVFKCPDNITVEAAEEESYALVHLTLPEGTDNSGVEPIIWSKPPFLPDYPLPLKIGATKIEVYATDPSDNGDFCAFYVEVQDKQVPKVYNCESPPSFYMSNLDSDNLHVNWTEPIFTDNSATPLNVDKSHEFGNFSLGTTSVVYVATDASGNSANCTLNITVAENPCSERPALGDVQWNCSSESNLLKCTLSCPSGLTWTTNSDLSNVTFVCQYDRNGAKWSPDVFSDMDSLPECSAFEVPTEVIESHEIELDGQDVTCDDLEALSRQVSNEINILIGSDEATQISIVADCVDSEAGDKTLSPEEESNYIPGRRRRSAGRKRVKVHVSFIGKSNETNTEDMVRHVQVLGRKVEEEYSKNSFIRVGGMKVKVQSTKMLDGAKLRCNPGFALKRGLCVKCPAGTFYDASKSNCTPCPIGTFQNVQGQLHCESCPAGFLTRRRRRKQLRDCKEICPPGTFGKIKNKQQRVALKPCNPCPVGSYQPLHGQVSCVECPAEQTTTKKGSSRAEQCVDKLAIEDPCYKFTCKNNGTCFVYNGYPYCLCPEGYLGSFCERERNHCDSSPCYNNGECVPVGVTSFTCTCPRGYEGDLCQFEVDECSSSPCKNGAECIDLVNAYKCDCLPGFTGFNCEEDIDECKTFDYPCLNNGTCNDLVNDYSCTCADGFSGRHCEEISECDADGLVDKDCRVKVEMAPEEANPCAAVVCPDNMECTTAGGSRNLPLCVCRQGYYGRNCSQEINFNVILTFPRRSVTEYMAVDFPPKDIREISVCFWLQAEDLLGYDTLFSYAVRKDDNAFTITDNKGFVLYVNKERVVTDIVANDGHWHFICVTWESEEGAWEIFFDGKSRRRGKGLSEKKAIPGGGRFIVGQEQDRFGGGFSEVESFVGRITHFDIWRSVLGPLEVQDMNDNCRYYEGDLFSWVHLLGNIRGNVEISKSTFCANCNARELRLFKGKISIQNMGDSTFGVYECDKGFRIRFDDQEEEMDTHVWYRKCLKHGNWEATVPKCSRVNCGFPGYFLHGVIAGNSYLFTDVIEYRCDRGYTLVGNHSRECLENGTWSGEPPTCKGSSGFCEQILAPRHGSMFIYFGGRRKLHSSAIGDRAEFICDDGFRLRGSSVLTCSEEGLWDNDVPTCEQTSCTFPSDSISSYVVNSTSDGSFAAGERLHVRCGELDDLQTIECQTNGSWNYSIGLCATKCEGGPQYPEYGLLIGDPLKYIYRIGEVVYAKCRYGYKLLGDNFFTCTTNGVWHQRNKTLCQPIECVKPIPPPNAKASPIFSTYPHGRRIVFRCSPGFRQIGELLTRCDGEGKWTKIYGRCVEMSCGVPNVPNDVIIIGTSYAIGDKIKFQCANGRRATPDDAFCQAHGTWSQLPRCL